MSGYNYEGFSAKDYDFENATGPKMGQAAPDVWVNDLAGNRKRMLDFEGELLVLEIGSLTCPLFQTRRGKMAKLYTGDTPITSVVLYTREAHPGSNIPQHKTIEDKHLCARRLRDEDGERRMILVDDLQGTAHAALGGMPNTLFIINRNGCVVFRAEWNNPTATQAALDALIHGKPLNVRSYFQPGHPRVALHTLRRAGMGSGSDFLRSFPAMIWQNVIKRNFRTLFGTQEHLSGDTTC